MVLPSMKKFITLAFALLYILLPATAFAYNPLGDACGAGGSSSVCSASKNNPIVGPNGVLEKVTIVMASIAGVAAVIIIIVAGLMYVTSNGDTQKAEGARRAIIGALVGIVIILAAASIITFVVNKV